MVTVRATSAQDAFNRAIVLGILSADPLSPRYAGLYMAMGPAEGQYSFKHIDTREYIRS